MNDATSSESERVYIDSLRWRRGDLEAKLATTRESLETLSKQETGLREELRAVDQLLFAASGTAAGDNGAGRRRSETTSPRAEDNGLAAGPEPSDLVGYGPTAQKIYACADQVIREAGVPLHYRVLADEVHKRIHLGGKDPGATLMAHLHRAQDLFPRLGRGVYGVPGMVDPEAAAPEQTASKSGRRRRTQRRTR